MGREACWQRKWVKFEQKFNRKRIQKMMKSEINYDKNPFVITNNMKNIRVYYLIIGVLIIFMSGIVKPDNLIYLVAFFASLSKFVSEVEPQERILFRQMH